MESKWRWNIPAHGEDSSVFQLAAELRSNPSVLVVKLAYGGGLLYGRVGAAHPDDVFNNLTFHSTQGKHFPYGEDVEPDRK